jgi:hypothetical protein
MNLEGKRSMRKILERTIMKKGIMMQDKSERIMKQ